jgi:hypothetical protein
MKRCEKRFTATSWTYCKNDVLAGIFQSSNKVFLVNIPRNNVDALLLWFLRD